MCIIKSVERKLLNRLKLVYCIDYLLDTIMSNFAESYNSILEQIRKIGDQENLYYNGKTRDVL